VTCGELDNRMFQTRVLRRGRRRSGTIRFACGEDSAATEKRGLTAFLIHDELIVIPAQSGVDGPVAEVDEVLKKGRLFEVRRLPVKAKVAGVPDRMVVGSVVNWVAVRGR